jgi:uncharacterized iron-regulated membrane protein
MELIGEEKKIQALFSELRFADERTMPQFAALWNRAQAVTVRPARTRAFTLSFAAVTAMLVIALVSLALWSTFSQRNRSISAVVATRTSEPAAVPASVINDVAATPTVPGEKRHRPRSTSGASSIVRKAAAQRRALMLAVNRKAAQDAKAISSWESPTATLLKSQNDDLLKSLPQLSDSVNELKSFLPNSPK